MGDLMYSYKQLMRGQTEPTIDRVFGAQYQVSVFATLAPFARMEMFYLGSDGFWRSQTVNLGTVTTLFASQGAACSKLIESQHSERCSRPPRMLRLVTIDGRRVGA